MLVSRRNAFTIIELLVVIAIVGVLAAMLVPAVQRAREAANRVICKNNLKQIGLAMHLYHDQVGAFPAGYTSTGNGGPDAGPGWGWAATILPNLEQSNVHDQIDFTKEIGDPANAAARCQVLKIFLCPSDERIGTFQVADAGVTVAHANYVGMFGTDEVCEGPDNGSGILYRNSRISIIEIADGSSNTLLVGERSSNLALATWCGAVTGGTVPPRRPNALGPEEAGVLVLGHTGSADEGHTPNSSSCHVDDFWSRHPLGVNFLFADGSVRVITNNIPRPTWAALGTRAGGEPIGGY